MNNCDKEEKKGTGQSKKVHCTAFCPKCGSDLYYFESQCMCKNKECNWSCGGCSNYRK
jgi:transcription initiation factor IIE alpha subunit